jgi:hypothetical protein
MPGFFFSLKQGFRGKDSGMRIPGIKIPGKGFGG